MRKFLVERKKEERGQGHPSLGQKWYKGLEMMEQHSMLKGSGVDGVR